MKQQSHWTWWWMSACMEGRWNMCKFDHGGRAGTWACVFLQKQNISISIVNAHLKKNATKVKQLTKLCETWGKQYTIPILAPNTDRELRSTIGWDWRQRLTQSGRNCDLVLGQGIRLSPFSCTSWCSCSSGDPLCRSPRPLKRGREWKVNATLVSLRPCSHAGAAAHRQIGGPPQDLNASGQDRDGVRATTGLEAQAVLARWLGGSVRLR
jgi:hypothetical protein